MGDTKIADEQSLYERDFYEWTQAQAAALRAAAASGNAPLDYENLAEEIESLGRRDRRELNSRIVRIIEHLLKLELSSAVEPRAGWLATVGGSGRISRTFSRRVRSLRRHATAAIESAYETALRLVMIELQSRGEMDPKRARELRSTPIRYTADQVLGEWLPPRAEPSD